MNSRAMIKPFRSSLIALLAGALLLSGCKSAPSPADPPLAGAAIGGPFTLVDKDGKTVRWSDFKGFYRIVYFGYTFCPDACPTDVAVAMRGLDAFAKSHPKEADRIRPIFISIDPARDTPKVVGEFAAAFSPRLIGLTGTSAQVDQAAKAFAAYYARGKETSGGYLMDHSRIAYLMGPDGQPISMLPVDKGPQAVAEELATWVK
ncbi:SCO family protein [Novosphingobium humi]|uniref:SCO family protein n=1 Tax=Novosphingobium humi TaxID=2282397 RepID=A0ABY7TWE9_9SPHN|nr:SCO family protein [Novosphingobium humi]WCT77569.1 SCO family protein [Novosphingobium humi]WJS98907.1 SCO family protein [Novosphingobium humi]